MYIQITTRCNMECGHCCYSCTNEGEDMTTEVFKKALAYDDEVVSIGGGEPTIHPKFWEFISLALGTCDYVWLSTNVKNTEIALMLAKLHKKKVLQCELSLDEYHEYIEEEVRVAFWKIESIRDVTRDGSKNPIRIGRAKDILDEDDVCEEDETCPCSEFVVKPNGDVMACGCEDAPRLGNVTDDQFDLWEILGDDYEWGECCHRQTAKC